MSIKFTCERCGREISAPAWAVDMPGKCKHCGTVQKVPQSLDDTLTATVQLTKPKEPGDFTKLFVTPGAPRDTFSHKTETLWQQVVKWKYAPYVGGVAALMFLTPIILIIILLNSKEEVKVIKQIIVEKKDDELDKKEKREAKATERKNEFHREMVYLQKKHNAEKRELNERQKSENKELVSRQKAYEKLKSDELADPKTGFIIDSFKYDTVMYGLVISRETKQWKALEVKQERERKAMQGRMNSEIKALREKYGK